METRLIVEDLSGNLLNLHWATVKVTPITITVTAAVFVML
jgi:hypothetical protein